MSERQPLTQEPPAGAPVVTAVLINDVPITEQSSAAVAETTLAHLSPAPADAGFYAGWHYDIFDRCCACTFLASAIIAAHLLVRLFDRVRRFRIIFLKGSGDCCVAWIFPCVALGQVASKLASNGVPTGRWTYRSVIIWGLLWIFLDFLFSGGKKVW